MAIGYGNNILYFFVFLLVSMGMTTAWLTNKNIDLLRLKDIHNNLLFAKEVNQLRVQLENKSRKIELWDIEIKNDDINNEIGFKTISQVVHNESVVLDWVPAKRGYSVLPRLMIQSRFPFKLLRSWKYFEKNERVVIYPERKGAKNLQSLLGQQLSKDQMAKLENEGLFRDYREFQNSDSPSRIDWKRSVKHQKHLVKNYERSGDRKILIDWDMTAFTDDFEERISQMTVWVDSCYQLNESFSLKIKSYQTDYFTNAVHYKTCLEKLALLTQEDVA